jgi:hypothetical protein
LHCDDQSQSMLKLARPARLERWRGLCIYLGVARHAS